MSTDSTLQALYTSLDYTSLLVVVATVADILPPLAALMSTIWMIIRIYETDTFQCWWKGHTFKGDQCIRDD